MAEPGEIESGMVSTQPSAARLGFWTSVLLAVVTAAAFVSGITTPPRSGPFCTGHCITYPFTDAVQYVPRDYLWVLPGILLAPTFVILACCAMACVEERRRYLSTICICFASIATAILTIDYFIQFQVVEPSLIRGEVSGLALFTQYNPHGLFIALEDLAYLMLSAAFLFEGLSIPSASRIAKLIHWLLVLSAVLTFTTFAGMTWSFGLNIEYRFEVAIITIVWTTLILAGILFSFFFRKMGSRVETDARESKHNPHRLILSR
ncbi:MAG TPA: hypothetical protein VMX38_11030 [Verrucomicrobiae bacterium]|nr:hypothetical protein [Verrucomicrobiae bacterium]